MKTLDETAETPIYLQHNLIYIFIITLFAVMGVASLAPAFPAIVEHFQISKQQVAWLVAVFTLPGVFLTPFAGILADRFGRKTILLPALLVFGLAGGACMFTEKYSTLLVYRFIQGIGAAPLGSLNVTLIGDLYTGKNRTSAMGYNASVLSIGTAAYPAIGGLLAAVGWQFPFLLPLLAIPAALIIFFKLKNPEPEFNTNLKTYFSNLLKTINQKKVFGFFVLNILVFFLIYGAYITYLPMLLKDRMMADSVSIGITMSVMSLTTAVTSFSIGKITEKVAKKNLLLISTILYFVSMLILSQAQSWWIIILPILFFGLAQGLFLPIVQTLLVSFAPLGERAAFMSVNSMVLRIGQTIGPAAIGFAYSLGGISGSYIAGAVVALIMMGIVFILRNQVS